MKSVKEIARDAILFVSQIEPCCSSISNLSCKIRALLYSNVKNKYNNKYYNKLQRTKSRHLLLLANLDKDFNN